MLNSKYTWLNRLIIYYIREIWNLFFSQNLDIDTQKHKFYCVFLWRSVHICWNVWQMCGKCVKCVGNVWNVWEMCGITHTLYPLPLLDQCRSNPPSFCPSAQTDHFRRPWSYVRKSSLLCVRLDPRLLYLLRYVRHAPAPLQHLLHYSTTAGKFDEWKIYFVMYLIN